MKRFIAILSAMMLAPCSVVTAQDEPKDPATIRTLLKYEPDIGQRITVALADAESASEFWVGLQVAIPEDAERKKLNVPKDQNQDAGLIVQQVVPDAPGDKAGIKVGDLLMKLGDKSLKSLSDPLDAIRDAKDSKLGLTFVRDGKVFEVVIKPTRRPANFGLYGPEPKEAGGAEPPGKAADALRKLDKVLESRRAEFAPSADLQKIRAELAEIQQRIANVNRQLAQFQSTQASPDRERIVRQMAAMKRAAAELAEVGRTEDADRLKEELRKLSEKLKALGQPGAGDAPLKGALVKPPATFSVTELGDRDAASATTRAMAFLQRAQTELPSAVPPEVRRAMVIQRAEPDGAAIAELRKQVEELRREVKELRDSSAKSKDSHN
jgi:hypothetical protein